MRRIFLLVLVLPVVFVSVGLLAGEDATPEDLFKLGTTYEKEKTYKKAIDAYERFLKAAPGDPQAFDAAMGIARSMLGLRQWSQAVKRLGPVLEKTGEGTLDRARCLKFMGTTTGLHSGGSSPVVAQLEQAEFIFLVFREVRRRKPVLLRELLPGIVGRPTLWREKGDLHTDGHQHDD